MHIGPLGLPEIIIIVVIIVVLFPGIFKKLGKRFKETGEAAKKGIEAGAKAAGTEIDLDNIKKEDILDKVESLQDKIEAKLDDFGKDDEEKAETAAPEEQPEEA